MGNLSLPEQSPGHQRLEEQRLGEAEDREGRDQTEVGRDHSQEVLVEVEAGEEVVEEEEVVEAEEEDPRVVLEVGSLDLVTVPGEM